MYRIGIISDTHGLLRPQVLDQLKECEMILHGGDINKQSILEELEQIAPVYAVRGNNDKDWAVGLPETLDIEIHGVRIFMIHNKKLIPGDLRGIDVILYGHSHRYEERKIGQQLWLNPGSCGPRRFTQPITMAVLKITEEGVFSIEKIEIPHGKSKQAGKKTGCGETTAGEVPENIKTVIETVVKEADRGRSVKQIAKKNQISEELAEQICRMYFTHPGVDADGIMTKLGL